MKEQFRRWGILYDWDKEVTSCEPEYYRWNQWLFNRMLEKGLAYRGKSPSTGVRRARRARERAGGRGRVRALRDRRRARDLEQWFLRITEYADRLLEGLDRLPEWPEKVKTMQRNWIGRLRGAICVLRSRASPSRSPCSPRGWTRFTGHFVALAPEHPWLSVSARLPRPDFGEFVDRLRTRRDSSASRRAATRRPVHGGVRDQPFLRERVRSGSPTSC